MKYENDDEKNLREYAKKAKIKIFFNNYLKEKLKFLEDYTKVTKKILNECISKKSNESLSLFKNYQNEIKNDNNKFHLEFERINNKYELLLNNTFNDMPFGNPILLEEKNNNFCLKFIESENSSIMHGLDKSIKQSKNHELNRENIRDTIVSNEKGDKEMEKYITYLQNIMLYELKKCNSFNEKIKKYKIQKIDILNNIHILNNYISNNKNNNKINIQLNVEKKEKQKKEKPKNEKKAINKNNILISFRHSKNKKFEVKLDEDLQENNSDDENNKKKIKGKNKIINEFKNINELFNTSINNIDLEQEIHGDEGIYENKFENQNQLSTNYIKQIHKTIPKLKLGLIEYNQKNNRDIDIYSFERRKFIHKTLQNQLKDMLKKKESAELRLNNLKKKVEELEKLNKTIKENYKSIKLMVNYNNSVTNIEPDLVVNSLNNGKNNNVEEEKKDELKNIDDDLIQQFFDNIEEVEEEYIGGNDNLKLEEIDTKDTKKEDEKEKLNNNLKSTRKLGNKINKFSIKSTIKAFNKNISLKRTKSK